MARIFDLVICPVCESKKTIDDGKVMKDAKIYNIIKICPKCKGHGRIGKERLYEDEENNKSISSFKRLLIILPSRRIVLPRFFNCRIFAPCE